MKGTTVRFSVDENRYVMLKLQAIPDFTDKLLLVLRDKKEITVVAKEGFKAKPIAQEKFFRLITFETEMPFGLTGFLSHIATILADKDVPLFAFSSYSTDHILVKEELLESAVDALKTGGFNLSR
jgi:uncharacterized protein